MRVSRSALLFGAGLVLVWLVWLILLVVGPGLVEAAYEGRSLGFLNALISGSEQHELSRYLDIWDRLALRVTLGLAVATVVAVALFVARERLGRGLRRGIDAISFRIPARWPAAAFFSVVVGLAAGAIEVAQQAVMRTVRAWPTGDFYWDKLWLTPLAMALSMLVIGSLLFPLTRPWRARPTLGLLPSAIAAIAVYPVARAVGGIHPLAAAVLTVGVVVALTRAAARSPAVAVRLVRRTGLALLVAIAGFGLGLHGTRAIGEWRALGSGTGPQGGGLNVLMIILDTVRSQSMSLYGHDRPTTPNIDRFAQSGVVFDRAWAPTAWTLPSHASLFTGRPASELRTDYLVGLDGSHPTLAEALADRGYATAGFVANFYYASRQSGLARGFAHYEDHPLTLRALVSAAWLPRRIGTRIADRRPYFEIAPRKRAERINRDFLDWLDSRPDRPFFAFLNYLDAHTPYDPPEPYRSRFGGGAGRYSLAFNREYPAEELRALEDHYDGALAYVDAYVGRLIERLEEMGILENTLVIIASDHGEEFGEHGARLVMHGRSLYSPGLHVPLIMVGPGRIPAGVRVEAPVAIANVAATVLDIVGDSGGGTLPGSSLARFWESGHRAAVPSDTIVSVATRNPREGRLPGLPIERGSMRSLLVDRWHLIVNGDGEEELYDVISDPWEHENLIAAPGGAAKGAQVRALLDARTSPPPARSASR